METTFHKPKNKGFLMTSFLTILSICANAQQSGKFVNNLTNDLTKDSAVSLYIIGGIALFGAILYFVAKKFNKEDDNSTKTPRTPFTHRHHHHQHKMVKKSS